MVKNRVNGQKQEDNMSMRHLAKVNSRNQVEKL